MSQTRRRCADRTGMTPSEVFMPERARMYFLSLVTTTRMSPSSSASLALAAGGGATTRRAGEAPADPDEVPADEEGADAAGAAGRSAAACCCRQAASLGERFSTAHASRWRMVGRCASQQPTEQKNRPVRATLAQVDTLHSQ